MMEGTENLGSILFKASPNAISHPLRNSANGLTEVIYLHHLAGPRGFEPRISGFAGHLSLISYELPSFKDRERLVKEFYRFCRGQLSLRHSTAETHAYLVGKFLREVEGPVSAEVLSEYLLKIKEPGTRKNYLSAFKRFFRDFLKLDIVNDFKSPTPNDNPTPCPTDEDVRLVYQNLEYDRDRLIYLMAGTAGLRRGEILNLLRKHIDFKLKSIIPHKNTKTKRTGITFYNGEVEPLLRKFLTETDDPETRLFCNTEGAIRKQLIKAWNRAGVKVTLQMLRVWFSNKMGDLGVQDRYIDIFCGRAPICLSEALYK